MIYNFLWPFALTPTFLHLSLLATASSSMFITNKFICSLTPYNVHPSMSWTTKRFLFPGIHRVTSTIVLPHAFHRRPAQLSLILFCVSRLNITAFFKYISYLLISLSFIFSRVLVLLISHKRFFFRILLSYFHQFLSLLVLT